MMDLYSRIETILEEEKFFSGKKEQKTLSKKYREAHFSLTPEEKKLYLLTRLPATARVILKVFQELKKIAPEEKIATILDMGAGPGSSSLAIEELFSDCEKITYMEREDTFIRLGKRLFPNPKITWEKRDLQKTVDMPTADLTLMSYVIGEMAESLLTSIFEEWIVKEGVFFVLIEPGTPRGFSKIVWAREFFLSRNFYVVAPCPHDHPCPLVEDFCHFSVRLERSRLHRLAKEGTLGYEDEKFSYVIISRKPFSRNSQRIIRHPLKKEGHVIFSLCTDCGLKERTISRKEDVYKEAKKWDWGDSF